MTSMTDRLRPLALAATLALGIGATACSSDDLADRVAEGIAERTAGEDVDVNLDSESGRFEVSTPDGDFALSTDELPDGFPDEVPLPDGLTITTSMRIGEGGSTGYTVAGQVERPADAVADELTTAFEAGSWDETMRTTSSFDGSDSTTVGYSDGRWNVTVSVMGDDDGGSAVTYSVSDES